MGVCALFGIFSCKGRDSTPSKELIGQIGLKRGQIISCSPSEASFGLVNFRLDLPENIRADFNLAVELLHSFEYDEAEKVFARILDEQPGCSMAYWGVAMCNFHPLWTPPTEAELRKGSKAIEIAKTIRNQPAREAAYLHSIESYFSGWETTDHRSRCLRYEKAMEDLYRQYPGDPEAAIFYALALDASADPADKTFARQEKAANILNALYPSQPNHPGIIHYLIHTYDYPGLAGKALPFARTYARVAPSSAHALHMPSHIFTRLGLWEECIRSNLVSVASAKCYAEQAGIRGHWDEELHGMDYLVYAYLQRGENQKAREQLDYLDSIREVYPVNFKVAYAFAAIPSRYSLENKDWRSAASLTLHPAGFPWRNFPWQESIVHFTRAMGAIHLGDQSLAQTELANLQRLHDTLAAQKDSYKTGQVAIQVRSVEAWMQFLNGNKEQGLALMNEAAVMEDQTEKHPVTPGEVLPARELLADMYFQSGQYQQALDAYEKVLEKNPRRFNSLYGAARSADKTGNKIKARTWYAQLEQGVKGLPSERPELEEMKIFLAGN